MARRRRRKSFGLARFAWQLSRKNPAFLVITFLLGLGWYGYEVVLARPQMAYMGIPEATSWRPGTWTRVFRNEGFMVGYSDLRGNPLWVIYRLAPVPEDAQRYRRPDRFATDWRSLVRIDHDDYTDSGYDRGHLAPNYAISRLYGRSAQLDTFLMTNITPQKPRLNQKLWQRLEEVEVDIFARHFGTLWVVTGPIFGPETKRLPTSMWVEIPEAFYKIYVVPARTGKTPQMLAFVVPQDVKGTEPLDRFVTSVDQVEALTGLDFFHQLEDTLENALEARSDPRAWPLDAATRLPSRY